MDEKVVLIDEQDNALGVMDKQRAHELGFLHRAISVFIFNGKNELLLQQRATHKYHSPLLWTNTCCSHPRWEEPYEAAAQRRLMEEMGISCDLEEKFHFIYKADVGKGLIEHELDYVFVGYSDEKPQLNPEEAHDFKWQNLDDLQKDLQDFPEKYTEWFKIIFDQYLNHLHEDSNCP